LSKAYNKAALAFCNASKANLRSVQRPSAVSLSGKRVMHLSLVCPTWHT